MAIDAESNLSTGRVPEKHTLVTVTYDKATPSVPAAERVEEDEAAAIAATQKRVTPELVDSAIARADYWHVEGTTTTVCVLTLRGNNRDGWTTTGTSGCYDPANFDPAFGRAAAYRTAREAVFSLLAYDGHRALRELSASVSHPHHSA